MEAFEFFRHPNRLARNAGKELLADTYDPEHTVEFTPVFAKEEKPPHEARRSLKQAENGSTSNLDQENLGMGI